MNDIWFDTTDGSLHSGEATRFEAAGNPALRPLRSLLEAPTFDFKRGDFENEDVSAMDRNDYICLGKTVLRVLETAEGPQPVTYTHLVRLYILGLGPEPKRYEADSRFGSIGGFREAIGSPPIQRGRFDNWSLRDFANYALKVEIAVGRKPVDTDFDKMAEDDGGPTYAMIHRRAGGIPNLNEMNGHPNIHRWQEGHFISWGVDVMFANGKLTRPIIDVLSKRKLGPSTRTVVNRFGSLGKLQWLVQEAYDEQVAGREARLRKYTVKANNGRLPHYAKDCNEEELLEIGGKYEVAAACLPNVHRNIYRFISRVRTSNFIEMIRHYDPDQTAGDVETIAESLGVFDEIWTDNRVKRLVVTAEELKSARKKPKNANSQEQAA